MNFAKHSDISGQHAFLSGSKYHWLNYDEEKLVSAYKKFLAVQKGIELHAFAATCIRLGQKLPKGKKTLNLYVNDCIGYRMIPEQPLYYSPNAYGTADAISFRDNSLKIFDLKTGVSPVSLSQLQIYCGLFCLEYGMKPNTLEYELRIYQSDEITISRPTGQEISEVAEKIVLFNKKIEMLKLELL